MTNRDILVKLFVEITGKSEVDAAVTVDGVAAYYPDLFTKDFHDEVSDEQARFTMENLRRSEMVKMFEMMHSTKRNPAIPLKKSTMEEVRNVFD